MRHSAWFVSSSIVTLSLVAFVAMPRPLEAEQAQVGVSFQTSADMRVTANVVRNCELTVQPLAFGTYDPVRANFTAPLDGQTTLTVACTKGTAVTIAMDSGTNAQGPVRRMTSGGANYLTYEVYKDSSRTEVWGATGGGVLSGGIAPSRDPRQFIVYGRVAGGQDIAEGAFQDTVVVTVQF